jgi:hypothetical protein
MASYERTESDKRDVEIAGIILQQLGGKGRLKAMCGAKYFAAIKSGLSFRMPSHFAKNGINVVEITLNPADTYDVKFKKLGPAPKYDITVVSEHDGIYNDMLRELFEKETGLYLTLGKVVMRQTDYDTMKSHRPAPRKVAVPRLTR